MPVAAQQAGSLVTNVATAQIGSDAPAGRIVSNPAVVRLDEVLDVGLATPATEFRLPLAGTTALPFTVANRGNGQEAFALSTTLTDIDGAIDGMAVDVDGNGAFDPAVDRLLGRGEVVTDPLAPGAALALLLLLSPTRIGGSARVAIGARAVTGSGTPGTTFAGRGDGGTDAVVGSTSAAASIDRPIYMSLDAPDPTLTKSQSVRAPDGSDRAMAGAVITYTLVTTFAETGAAADAVVSDPIPARTAYVAGSLMLDDAPLSDAADGDAGTVGNGTVSVALGAVSAPATHTIRFQVTIR